MQCAALFRSIWRAATIPAPARAGSQPAAQSVENGAVVFRARFSKCAASGPQLAIEYYGRFKSPQERPRTVLPRTRRAGDLTGKAKDAKLRANLEERAKVFRKGSEIRRLLDEGKSLDEAEAFLHQCGTERLAELLMGMHAGPGKPISREAAMVEAQTLIGKSLPESSPRGQD
jgi:hypothetical protein